MMTQLRLLFGRLRVLALAGAVLALTAGSASALIATSPASAYVHSWSCYEGAYGKCYDNSGKTYNPWHLIGIEGGYNAGYCAKGETSSGSVIEFKCMSGFNYAIGVVCTSTETHAYGYSNFNGQTLYGRADTEGGC